MMRRTTKSIDSRIVFAAAVFVSSIALFSCGRSQTHNGSPSNQAAAAAAVAPSQSPLCQQITDGQNELTQIQTQINSEGNPLRQAEAQNQYQQKAQQLNASLQNFLAANTVLNDYSGTVSAMSYRQYSQGPGVDLSVSLPCNVDILIRFLDVTNPGWGSFNPTQFSALGDWRPTLENLSQGETVAFSARIIPSLAGGYTFPWPGTRLTLQALVTKLGKQ